MFGNFGFKALTSYNGDMFEFLSLIVDYFAPLL